jgi:hypothetical protein
VPKTASHIGYELTRLEVIAWLNEHQVAMPRVRSMNALGQQRRHQRRELAARFSVLEMHTLPPDSIIEVGPKPG